MRSSLTWIERALRWIRKRRASAALPSLDYPLPATPRIAVLGFAVQETAGILPMREWTPAELEKVSPEALAGPIQELAALGALLKADKLKLPELCYPLLVISTMARGPLSEEQHEKLWHWFHLPVYEQIRDENGDLLAYECDVRDGFHLASGVPANALRGVVLASECECGNATARVRLLEPQPMKAFAARA